MGKAVSFNYRGSAKYGTSIGGIVSILIRYCIWFLTIVEIWHCFDQPGYTEELQFNQLHTPNEERYQVQLDQGLPAFYIISNANADTEATYNDLNYFTYEYQTKVLKDGVETNTTIAALPCSEIVPKYVSDPYTRAQILDEFAQQEDVFLCPDLASYELYYPSWLNWGVEKEYSFIEITVKALDTTPDEVKTRTGVQIVQVHPFYNPP